MHTVRNLMSAATDGAYSRPAAPAPVLCREERDQRRADIEHLASSLVSKVNECVAAIDEGEHWLLQYSPPSCLLTADSNSL